MAASTTTWPPEIVTHVTMATDVMGSITSYTYSKIESVTNIGATERRSINKKLTKYHLIECVLLFCHSLRYIPVHMFSGLRRYHVKLEYYR
jgi:hypothetical protein